MSRHQEGKLVGLLTPYIIERKLYPEEIEGYLDKHHKEEQDSTMSDFDSVIEFNENYIEVIDDNYFDKGKASLYLFGTSVGFMGLGLYCIIHFIFVNQIYLMVLFFIISLLMSLLMGKFLLHDWFKKTHYPVRFDRKNKLVHVYQYNNDIISLSWNDVYFTLYKNRLTYCLIGHVLASDYETVINSFSFGRMGNKTEAQALWRFIRCYMEEDCIEELSQIIEITLPIAEKKENYLWGFLCLSKMNSWADWLFSFLIIPQSVISSLPRYIGMRTCKIPQWNKSVLELCRHNGNGLVDKNSGNNPDDIYRYMLLIQSKERRNEILNRREKAMEEINIKPSEKYGSGKV
ncbi:DUF6708 domain-containing protein [Morganella psychrotolerans]|uniref:DUF6708 domain-containing protein n=1 Tax=Morganella psychrotolerans TaxID=368603 RepID=UPI0039AF07DC